MMGRWVAVVLVVASSIAHAQPALDKPAFTAKPAELLALAKTAPAGDWAVVVLREEVLLEYDVAGRALERRRVVYVVRTQVGVDHWATITTAWSPFYQDKPSLKARVIEPDGKVVELDSTLITDSPTSTKSATTYSDRRKLEAPLPRLRIGSIVEQAIVIRDRQPILEAGSVNIVTLGDSVPTSSSRVTVSGPIARNLKVIARNLPGASPRRQRDGTLERWSYDLGPLAARAPAESNAPNETRHPLIGVATGASWNAIARDYAAIVDRRILEGPVKLPTDLPRTPTLATARALTAWLHRQVRYTGIEFGEASNIPWPPAAVLKRGFGDCKDKSTLLVALLRQAGIRAELALLDTTPGTDVDRDLPGMGVFDHAIVRARIEGRDVWIDATADLVAMERLPPRDQGRRTLVIAPDSTGLIETPTASPDDNRMLEVRTFEISESGNATKVTEVSRPSGAFDAEERVWIRDTRVDDVRKSLAKYADSEYQAVFDRYTTTSPADLTAPFEITLVVKQAARAYTERGRVVIDLFPVDALDRVPELFKKKLDEPRRSDFVWWVPHVYEIENRLVFPEGFTLPTPAAERVRALGTIKLIERQRLEGRTLVVTFRCESGKRRISPSEVALTAKAVGELERSTIVVEHTAWSLMGRNKLREALVEVDRLITLHPKEALHHSQRAVVLSTSGMGAAARRAARKAVELEPAKADPYAILGWILRRDTVGREYGFDHDRKGALAAYEKARKLEPKHVGAIADHATLLEAGLNGRAYDRGSDLDGAIAARRALLALDEDDPVTLGKTLLVARRFAEAESVLRAAKPTDIRNMALLAAIAAGKNGPAAAIMEAGKLSAGAETRVLGGAAGLLMAAREYLPMRALFDHTGVTKGNPTFAAIVAKLVRRDAALDRNDPKDAYLEATLAVADPRYQTDVFADEEIESDYRRAAHAATNQVSHLVVLDMTRTVGLRVEGGPNGPWRLVTDVAGQKPEIVYLGRDRTRVKLLGTAESRAGVGTYVLRKLRDNDLPAAFALLDWVRADLDKTTIGGKAIAALWGGQRTKEAATLTAATFVSTHDDAAVKSLTKCASSDPDARRLCDAAMVVAYSKRKRWSDLDAFVARRIVEEPTSDFLRTWQIKAAAWAGRYAEALRDTDARLATQANDLVMLETRASVLTLQGKITDAVQAWDVVTKHAQAKANHYNQASWVRLVHGNDLVQARDLARKGVALDKALPRVLHTLAAIEAELGDLAAANENIQRATGAAGRSAPRQEDWFIYGRIAEHLGLRSEAIDAYRRVGPDPEPRIVSTGELAKRRLKGLQP